MESNFRDKIIKSILSGNIEEISEETSFLAKVQAQAEQARKEGKKVVFVDEGFFGFLKLSSKYPECALDDENTVYINTCEKFDAALRRIEQERLEREGREGSAVDE